MQKEAFSVNLGGISFYYVTGGGGEEHRYFTFERAMVTDMTH